VIRKLGGNVFLGAWRSLAESTRMRLMPQLLEFVPEYAKFRMRFPTLQGLLEHLKNNGFAPSAIVDVGAYVGDWSRTAAGVFPSAPLLMIDANPKNEEALQNAQREIGARSNYLVTLLGPEAKPSVRFYTLGTGSSVLPELTTYARGETTLPMNTLDSVAGAIARQAPILLKLDVQGFELEVLGGGESVLKQAEVVLLEAALLPYNEGAPLFQEVVRFMAEAGFAVYDFCGQSRRETDWALLQTDVVFARNDSPLRQRKKFWFSEP
jgi:FkbM family methyltransferase